MMVRTFQKPKKKAKYRYKAVPKDVMAIVEERSEGICEYCHRGKAVDPHHIHSKGRGGLDIAINILHVCRLCHDHDNTPFLMDVERILRKRIDKLFTESFYSRAEIADLLKMSFAEVYRQKMKRFLRFDCGHFTSKKEIKRWLTGGIW